MAVGASVQEPLTAPEPTVTVPDGNDFVPPTWMSDTVTVAETASFTATGFLESVRAVDVIRGMTVIEIVCVVVSGIGLLSVAVTENVNDPAAEGVPDRSPPGERVRPVGRVPPGVHVTFPEPPADWNAKPLPLL